MQVTDFIGSQDAGEYCKDQFHDRFWNYFSYITLGVHVLLSLYIMLTLLIILQRQGSGVLRHIDLATAGGAASLQEQLTAAPREGELTTSMFLQQLRLAKQIIEVPTRPFTAGHCLQLRWQAGRPTKSVLVDDRNINVVIPVQSLQSRTTIRNPAWSWLVPAVVILHTTL